MEATESVQEIDLVIELVGGQGEISQDLLNTVMGLLERPIVISRRAYWFLSEQTLNPVQQKALADFERKNQEYLW